MSMLCNSLSKNSLILSSFLNDDTKLIYECFIVNSQHRWPMSVCEVFEIIRSGGYFILFFFSPKSPFWQVWEKNQGPTQYWKVHQVLLWTVISFFFGTNLSNISQYSFNNSIDFVRSLMQNIKFLVRFYFVGGTIHPIQCE
jgi:hypothetical protein